MNLLKNFKKSSTEIHFGCFRRQQALAKLAAPERENSDY
jgi:hypothetical protein